MKKTIVLLSILSASVMAQEGPNDKKQTQNIGSYSVNAESIYNGSSLVRGMFVAANFMLGSPMPYEMFTRTPNSSHTQNIGTRTPWNSSEKVVGSLSQNQENK